MACEARVSFKMVFAGLGSVKADGFTAGGGEREASKGGSGGCARLIRVGGMGGEGAFCIAAGGCMGVVGVGAA
jgi:hypothetical protein